MPPTIPCWAAAAWTGPSTARVARTSSPSASASKASTTGPKDDAVRQALAVLTSAATNVGQATMVLFDDATLAVAPRSASERNSGSAERPADHADPRVRRIAVRRLVGDVDGAVLLSADVARNGEF